MGKHIPIRSSVNGKPIPNSKKFLTSLLSEKPWLARRSGRKWRSKLRRGKSYIPLRKSTKKRFKERKKNPPRAGFFLCTLSNLIVHNPSIFYEGGYGCLPALPLVGSRWTCPPNWRELASIRVEAGKQLADFRENVWGRLCYTYRKE